MVDSTEAVTLVAVLAIAGGGIYLAYLWLGVVGAATTVLTLAVMLYLLRGQLAGGGGSVQRESKGAGGGE